VEELLKEELGEEALNSQGDVLERINSAIESPSKKVVVFNLRNIDNPDVRTEITGVHTQEALHQSQEIGRLQRRPTTSPRSGDTAKRQQGRTTWRRFTPRKSRPRAGNSASASSSSARGRPRFRSTCCPR